MSLLDEMDILRDSMLLHAQESAAKSLRIQELRDALKGLLDEMGEDVGQRHYRDKYRVYQIAPEAVRAAAEALDRVPGG